MYTALFSLRLSRTGSASNWCALQEALSKRIDAIQHNTMLVLLVSEMVNYRFLASEGTWPCVPST